jgi:pimeloyl-ACP methyl ester carboxylesterase
VTREIFEVAADGGHLAGWVEGTGPNVLLLHGGPGLSANVVDGLADELLRDYRVALYQQRGLSPSTEEGPFTVDAGVADAATVLDGLGWDRAYVVGHSWGGHLALHLAVRLPERLLGVLSIDPVGGVGDGGVAAFEEEMVARIPEKNRARAKELDERELRGEGTDADATEGFALYWPSYFADPASAPPVPAARFSGAAYAGGYESMMKELPALEQRLATITIPIGFVAGAASPMPVDLAARPTAQRIPHAWIEEVPDAGHWPWMDSPGVVRNALDRLVLGAEHD